MKWSASFKYACLGLVALTLTRLLLSSDGGQGDDSEGVATLLQKALGRTSLLEAALAKKRSSQQNQLLPPRTLDELYIGCYMQSPAAPDMALTVPVQHRLREDAPCVRACHARGFKFAASVADGRACACGDTFGRYGSRDKERGECGGAAYGGVYGAVDMRVGRATPRRLAPHTPLPPSSIWCFASSSSSPSSATPALAANCIIHNLYVTAARELVFYRTDASILQGAAASNGQNATLLLRKLDIRVKVSIADDCAVGFLAQLERKDSTLLLAPLPTVIDTLHILHTRATSLFAWSSSILSFAETPATLLLPKFTHTLLDEQFLVRSARECLIAPRAETLKYTALAHAEGVTGYRRRVLNALGVARTEFRRGVLAVSHRMAGDYGRIADRAADALEPRVVGGGSKTPREIVESMMNSQVFVAPAGDKMLEYAMFMDAHSTLIQYGGTARADLVDVLASVDVRYVVAETLEEVLDSL